MAYVVEKENGKILDRCDAWDMLGIDNMIMDARAHGYENITFEITASGDMIIWAD